MSGKVESHAAELGENLMMIPANALEAALMYFPIPGSVEQSLSVFSISTIILTALCLMFWRIFSNKSLNARRFFVATYIFTVSICGYYGILFGAAWFVTRYFSALSPMLWIISFMVMYALLSSIFNKQQFTKLFIFGTSLLIVISAVSELLIYQKGTNAMHKPVVEWAVNNVDKHIWVGAAQTGTLGYFYDKTINLDDKTNLNALQAVLEQGQVLSYILDKTDIQHIIDWQGICGWTNEKKEPRFAVEFKVIVTDSVKNLCVMQRIR